MAEKTEIEPNKQAVNNSEVDSIKHGRLLIFIVAYNAEKTIESVLRRIPVELSVLYEVEVLIIDDSSQDNTFAKSEIAKKSGNIPFTITVLFNRVNQGYGGNQKIGFHYALRNHFDWVALVHGDGQYAPECLPQLLHVLLQKEADAVFGSRMLEGNSALKGGMPLYKFVGNKILTNFQNYILNSSLSEFHSGYRLYSTQALSQIPFDLNSNDFHFDTEIIIQLIIAELRIKELPIPTYYGDEICHVNGIKYAWNVFWTTLQAKVQDYHIFYDSKFDCLPQDKAQKVSYESCFIESFIIDNFDKKDNFHIIGEVSDDFVSTLKKKGKSVRIEQAGLLESIPDDIADIDYIIILDDTDISQQPDIFIRNLRELCRYRPYLQIILAVGNIGFIITRLLLFFGRFSYTKRGVISLNHARFFTLRSLKKLFSQNGFELNWVKGMPIQYNRIFKSKIISFVFLFIHRVLNSVRPSLFGYQLLISVSPKPSLSYLLEDAIRVSEIKRRSS